MLVDIYMKFLEDILNKFQVTELTQFCDKVPREITQKSINAKVTVFVLCTSSNVESYMKFHKDSLNGFQVLERT